MSQTKAQLLNPLGDLDLTGQLTGVGATFTGNITAVDGIFSGNVSVAGTLTKQDVTNVDSVGVITARSGIDVSGGSAIHAATFDSNNADGILINLQRSGTNKGFLGSGKNIASATGGVDDIGLRSNANLIFTSGGGTERLRIESGGNIKFSGELSGNNAANILNHSGGFNFYASSNSSNNNNIIFCSANTAASERLRITSDGKIGVGKTNPAEKLDVAGAIQVSSAGLKLDTHPLVTYASFTAISGGTYAARLGSTGSSTIRSTQIYGGGTEIATFDGVNQRLGIGTLAPNYTLELAGANSNNYISLVNTTAGDADGNRYSRILFRGTQSGGEVTSLAAINGAHEGTADDQKGNISFRTNDGNDGESPSEKLRIGSVGQIGIAGANYGTAGQVIISGGSGASVAWGDAAGGAEYAGISSGAMSAGDPVMVHPDGKLEKVQNSYNETIEIGSAANGDTEAASNPGVRVLYFPDENGDERYLFLYRYSMSNYYRTATRTGTNLTLSTRGNSTGQGAGHFAVGYNPDRKRAVMMFYQQSPGGYCAVRVIRPNSTTISGGSVVQVDTGGGVNGVGVAYHGDDKFVLVWARGGTVYSKILTVTSSSSWTGISLGSTVTVGSAGGNLTTTIHISEKDNNGKHMLFYPVFPAGTRYGGFGINYAVISVSGTTPSFGSISHLGGSAEREYETDNLLVDSSFDSSQNRYLVVYKQIHDGTGTYINKTYVVNAAISGTSITMSSQVELTNNITETTPSTVFDSNLNKHYVVVSMPTGSYSVVAHPFTFTGSATPSAGSTFNISTGEKVWYGDVVFNATAGKIIYGARNASSSGAGNWLRARVISTSTVQSNLTSDNFLGFSKGSYTDGNTAKIGTLSAVEENQTGLSTNTTYYVKPDGTLSTEASDPRVTAGKAVSSTSLIVKDAVSRPGSLGHWTYALYNCGVFKAWCACGYLSNQGGIIGAYECANSSCRYCAGRWNPYCCVQGDHVWNYDLPTESGGSMCIGCGGCSCCSSYNFDRACCCCWPTGRFWFPETGIYCYNFHAILSSCLGAPAGNGCWSAISYYSSPKNRNRACCNYFCGINGYGAYSTNLNSNCSPQQLFENIHMDGIVAVGDTTKNFMAFGLSIANSTSCVIKENGLTLRSGDGCLGRYPNYVSFQKISNDSRVTYCN